MKRKNSPEKGSQEGSWKKKTKLKGREIESRGERGSVQIEANGLGCLAKKKKKTGGKRQERTSFRREKMGRVE